MLNQRMVLLLTLWKGILAQKDLGCYTLKEPLLHLPSGELIARYASGKLYVQAKALVYTSLSIIMKNELK